MRLSEAVHWCYSYRAKLYFEKKGVLLWVRLGGRTHNSRGLTITQAVIRLRNKLGVSGLCNECGTPR